MASISSQANEAAQSVAELTKQLQDLTLTYENIAKNVDDTALEKLHSVWNAKGGFYVKALLGLKMLNEEFGKTNKKEERQIANRKKALDYVARERKHLDYLEKNNVKGIDYAKKRQRLQEIENKAQNPVEWAKHEQFLKVRNGLQAAGLVTLKLTAVGYAVLQSAIVSVVSWQNKMQSSLSKVARTLGTTSANTLQVRDAAKGSLMDPAGLGALGYGMEEITQQLTEFASKMEWTSAVTSKQAADLIKLGHGLGMTAGEVSELTRDIVVMGGTVKDTEQFMTDMMTSAKIAGVSAKTMAKQFSGAGKALFEVTGPKARQRLLESAGFFAKIGMSLDKMKGFIDMSDNFDQAATSMAKLNTAFGTHINALEVFAEQDADKRAAMVMKQMQMQGVNLNMSRQEKKLMAETLGIEMSQVNAMLNAVSSGKDFNKALQEQNDLQTKRQKMTDDFEETLWQAKESFFSMAQIAAKLWEGMTALLGPLFKGFKFTLGISDNVSFLQATMEKVTALTDKWTKALAGDKFGAIGDNLFEIGRAFGTIFDQIISFFSSEGFMMFVSGIVDMMTVVADIIRVILPPVMFVVKLIFYVVGAVMKLIAWLMPAIELVLGIAAVIWAVMGGIASIVAAVVAFFNPITIFIMAVIGAVVALFSIIRLIMKGIGWIWDKLFGKSDAENASDKAVGEQTAAVANVGANSGGKSISMPETVAPSTPGRAVGGPVTSKSPYIVGERGPELFVPSSSGYIAPNNAISAGGGGGDAYITVQVLMDGEVIQERMYKKNLRSIT